MAYMTLLCKLTFLTACGLVWNGGGGGSIPPQDAAVVCFNFNSAAATQTDGCGADDNATFETIQATYSSTGGPIGNDGYYTWSGSEDGTQLQIADSARFDAITTNNEFTVSFHINGSTCGTFGSSVFLKNAEFSMLRGIATDQINTSVSGPTGGSNVGTDTVCDSTWHHLAWVWDGPMGRSKLYVDGALIQNEAGWSGTLDAGAADFIIANYILLKQFAGSLDNVRIYDYAQTQGNVSTPNTIAYDNITAVP